MAEIVAKINAARAGGLDVASQIYPYTATSTDLSSIVSAWALDGGYLQFVARLKDPITRARIAGEMRGGSYIRQGGNGILVRGIQSPDPAIKAFERKRLDEIARTMKVEPVEAALKIFEASNASPIAIFFGLSEDDLKLAMKQPWVAVGSDSGAVVGPMRQFGAHPRAYGTFPRIIDHYVRERGALPLELAIHKMTGATARALKLRDRGLLAEGYRADIAIFDPADFRDRATYADPHQFPSGARTTWVCSQVISGNRSSLICCERSAIRSSSSRVTSPTVRSMKYLGMPSSLPPRAAGRQPERRLLQRP